MSTLFSSVSLAVLSSNPSFLKPSSSTTKLQLFFSHQDHLSFSFPRMVVSPSASTNLTVRTPPPSAIVSSSVPASMSAAGIDEGKMKQLISAITGHLASLGDGLEDLSSSPRDALTMVDVIERLGIQRYFQEQIHKIIHLSYLRWHEQLGFHDDADATLMGFRLLRLFGYYVTAGILDTLKGQFGDPSTFKVDTLAKVSSMIHLFKCSQVGFPSESTIMAQVKEFASFQLRQVFLEGDQSLLKANNLDMEIKFALEYPRRYLLPRLESRIVINQLWPGSGCLNKCLQLAKIDLGMLQKLHQQEIASLEQWWKEQECSKTIPFRGGILKSHFLASTSIYEPEYSAYRAAFTKCSAFIVTIDDLMDLPGVDHLDILKFNEAVQRWDPSGCDDVPKFKAILSSFLATVEDMGAEASRTQGRDVLPYYKRAWQELIEGYTENAQWRSESRIPSMEEYLKASLPSISSTAIALSSLLMLPEPISDEALRLTGPGSRFMHLTNLVCRLTNDLGTFEFEARNGEIASAVSCYMKEQGCRQEEAMDALEGIIRSCWCELEWELFRSIRVLPECYRRGMISITRNSAFVYKRGDSYSLADDKEYAMLLRDYFFKPIH
ncbi:bifunctional levopimaradiene synthase, chloroplastic-like isoform X2 [Zingiber officinale]|uniref:bifunctional levopimaradiene synthase, chloroplastic-like isoform X2 n=1 Tax=Zingiber officinale TaxID=94328 RepID=UPI001C4AA5C7|nr:bifunctional levopimaradiene synthase, chloroplastic-like isoform X2 [Zingiber officinale]XP_042440561.1 bifunctional levopimaradiene synthase, chloroplastic-like isoform X2 [Zingiber officinale]